MNKRRYVLNLISLLLASNLNPAFAGNRLSCSSAQCHSDMTSGNEYSDSESETSPRVVERRIAWEYNQQQALVQQQAPVRNVVSQPVMQEIRIHPRTVASAPSEMVELPGQVPSPADPETPGPSRSIYTFEQVTQNSGGEIASLLKPQEPCAQTILSFLNETNRESGRRSCASKGLRRNSLSKTSSSELK